MKRKRGHTSESSLSMSTYSEFEGSSFRSCLTWIHWKRNEWMKRNPILHQSEWTVKLNLPGGVDLCRGKDSRPTLLYSLRHRLASFLSTTTNPNPNSSSSSLNLSQLPPRLPPPKHKHKHHIVSSSWTYFRPFKAQINVGPLIGQYYSHLHTLPYNWRNVIGSSRWRYMLITFHIRLYYW